jgi:hypothetical protein
MQNLKKIFLHPYLAICFYVGFLLTVLGGLNAEFIISDDSKTYWVPFVKWLGTTNFLTNAPIQLPGGGIGGNYLAEAQLSQFNPVILLISLFGNLFTSLFITAFVLKFVAGAIFSIAAYRIFINVNITKYLAFLLACASTFTGFISYVETSSWTQSLFANGFMLMALSFALEEKLTTGKKLTTSFCLILGILMGYVYALLLLPVVIGVVFHQQIKRKNFRTLDFVYLVPPMFFAFAVFLPGLGAASVSWRTGWKPASNGFMTPNAVDLLGSAFLSMKMEVNTWSGAITESPWGYIFIGIPGLIAFFNWRTFRENEFSKLILFLLGAASLIFIAPSDFGPFHWPIRLMPVFTIFLMATLGMGYKRNSKSRTYFLLTIIVIGILRAMSVSPRDYRLHFISLVILLIFLILFLKWNKKPKVSTGFLLLSLIFASSILQHSQLFFNTTAGLARYYSPLNPTDYDINGIKTELQTFQLADIGTFQGKDDPAWKNFFFGHESLPLNFNLFNSGTALGHRNFTNKMCIGFNGATCPTSVIDMFTNDSKYSISLLDAMGVNQIISQKIYRKDIEKQLIQNQWILVAESNSRDVWQRKELKQDPLSTGKEFTEKEFKAEISKDSLNGRTYKIETNFDENKIVTTNLLNFPGLVIVKSTSDEMKIIENGAFDSFYALKIPKGPQEFTLTWSPRNWDISKYLYLIALSSFGITGVVLKSKIAKKQNQLPRIE